MSLLRFSCFLLLTGALTLYACGKTNPPSAPQNVTATSGEGLVTITWGSVADATSYNLYMATETGVTPSNYSTLADGTAHRDVLSPFPLTGLTNGLTYYFVLTAVNWNGESSESAEVSAMPLGTWVYEQVGSAATVFRNIFFIDNSTGWVAGAIQDPVSTLKPVPVAYKTGDGGDTWVQVFQDAEHGYAHGLHFVDNNNGWMSIAGMSSDRIYATTNGGDNWNLKYSPAFAVYGIFALGVNNAWAVGFSNSVLHTTDGFQTCESQHINDTPYPVRNIEMLDSSTGYIAKEDYKVFKTVDGGTNWSHVLTGPELFYAMDFVDENTGWVAGAGMDMWHTQNGGTTWEQQTVPSSLDVIMGISFIDNLHGWLTTAYGYFSADGGEIWRTGDGGQTWTLAYTDNATKFNKIQVNDFTHGWVSTSSGGVVRLK